MKVRISMVLAVLGVATSIAVSPGRGAEAGVILPVDPSTFAITMSTVTVSILQNNVDITDTWLPEPGQVVTIRVNGLSNPTIFRVPPPAGGNPIAAHSLTTSAYPGVCTNTGSDPGPDFTLDGNQLTSNDCGGMAVIVVNETFTFILPQDSNFNGIPDIWEARFCPPGFCTRGPEDVDSVAGGVVIGDGDGIAAFDEYRGFIVSGVHVRTDPRRKDLFVHLVNPQCGTVSLLGGGPITYPTDGTSLFASVNSLISGTQIHVLGYAPNAANMNTLEWVDNFVSATFSPTSNTVIFNISDVTTDRQINKNAVYPILDAVTGNAIQKGLRVTECLDVTATSPLGSAGLGSPNGPDNALLYTQRIVNTINGLVTGGGSRPVRYFTYDNGVAVLRFTSAGAPTAADRNFLISKAIQFYLAMELGHSVRLTPTVEGTRKTSYGYHHAPGTGSNLDQTIINTVDAQFNNFYIPSLYNTNDETALRLHN